MQMQPESIPQKIENARVLIRDVDRQIVYMIGKRLELVRDIAELKQEANLPIVDPEAEKVAVENILDASREVDLESRYGRSLAELLIDISVNLQQREATNATSKDQLLKRIFEKVQLLKQNGVEVVRFEIGEPNFEPPSAVINSAAATLQKKRMFGYGPAAGLKELREAVANELADRYDATIDPEQVLIVPGARFGIFATIMAFASLLDRIIVPQPAWPAYEECASFAKARVIPVYTKLEDNWDLHLDQMEAELQRGAKMLVLNSPCNPTGKAIGRNQFDRIIELAQEHDCLILSDEVYDRFVRQKVPSVLEYPDVDCVYVNSFSKQFGLTGWRVAYLVTSKERVADIRRVIQTAITCVPEFTQEAALHALKEGRGDANRSIEEIMQKVQLTCQELKKINVSFREPDGGFYVFPKVNKPNFDSVKFAEYLIDKYRISLSPGSSFGEYPEYFRLAVSLPKEQIAGAVKLIGEAIDAWRD